MLSEIRAIYENRGAALYGEEAVSQLQHGLQCAALAVGEGAPPALITAALLHDIGHLLGSGDAGLALRGIDGRHERTGAAFLRRWFGPEVTEPIRLHVAAKAYLCATEDGYLGSLSAVSDRSLALQGGVMSPARAEQFGRTPFAAGAIKVRRWDDRGKDPAAETPDFATFLSIAEAAATGPAAS